MSGQNVAIVAFGVVMAARILGLGRLVGEALAILVLLSCALAVGWQPSVVRAGVAGTLASLAWIVATPPRTLRPQDELRRWGGEGSVEYRIGYHMLTPKRGRWWRGQFCPFIPAEDLGPLLELARRESTIRK